MIFLALGGLSGSCVAAVASGCGKPFHMFYFSAVILVLISIGGAFLADEVETNAYATTYNEIEVNEQD